MVPLPSLWEQARHLLFCSNQLNSHLPQKEAGRLSESRAVRIRLADSPHIVDAELEAELEVLTSLVSKKVKGAPKCVCSYAQVCCQGWLPGQL